MIGESWVRYELQPAPRNLLCQFRRKGQGSAGWFVGYAKDFSSYFNIADLEWQLTGIAREQLDRMPPEVRAQVMPPTGGWAGMSTLSAMVTMGCAGMTSQVFADCLGGMRFS